jgi:hypothetical protein
VTYEVTAQVSQAVAKLTAEQASLKAAADKASARADAAESRVNKLSEELAKATNAETIAAAVQDRVKLETVAGSFKVKADGLSNDQIRAAVITKIDDSIKLDGKSLEYVIGLFEALTSKSVIARLTGDASVADSSFPAPQKSTAEKREAYRAAFFTTPK